MGKKIIKTQKDTDGTISAVKLSGNTSFTPIDKAIKMAKKGQIDDVVVVNPKDKKEHLRSVADNKKKNNLSEMD